MFVLLYIHVRVQVAYTYMSANKCVLRC